MADATTTDQSYWGKEGKQPWYQKGKGKPFNKSKDKTEDPGKDDKGKGKTKTFAVDHKTVEVDASRSTVTQNGLTYNSKLMAPSIKQADTPTHVILDNGCTKSMGTVCSGEIYQGIRTVSATDEVGLYPAQH